MWKSSFQRRALLAGVVVIFVAVVAGLTGSRASAAAPAPVSLQATVTIPNPVFGGVWSASGAITDSGTFLRTDLHGTGSGPNSPAVAAFQSEITFSGSQGTLVVRVQNSFMESGLNGVWEIESASGAYAGASGHGTEQFVFPNSLTLNGVISVGS